ncbi:isoprenoid synthase domain-containing protein [Chaetomium tenue]|uniref:Isoprenoid synthase domain-containing protein n=1 Tax=Chaetomium tenue TaxID=1854479 RepID=A0ACB7PF92_9PEZI|nr:isoprenoid synthase domain-containing protein [Chaetomium globosum]
MSESPLHIYKAANQQASPRSQPITPPYLRSTTTMTIIAPHPIITSPHDDDNNNPNDANPPTTSPTSPTAEPLSLAHYNTHGFCQPPSPTQSPTFPLARHRHETLANAGCHAARHDWARLIGPGPPAEFGACNPVNGNFVALLFPLCRVERLGVVGYVVEYSFLHDSVVEGLGEESSTQRDKFGLGELETTRPNIKAGRKQMQAKIVSLLSDIDKAGAARVMAVWKAMLSRTLRDKAKDFANLEEYIEFRSIDTGGAFGEALMLFGLGVTFTAGEDALLAHITQPCYASFALANDYFSFDREWADTQSKPGAPKPINAVWLYMQWRGVSAAVAKRLVAAASNRYEARFLELCARFRNEHKPVSPKLDLYLRGLSYQVSGNVVWSLNCPRYYPGFRYDPNAGLEDAITLELRAKKRLARERDAESSVVLRCP